MGWNQKASKGGDGNYERAPAGNHPAVLVALVDMGTQTVDGFQGGPSRDQHRAYMVWELVAEQTSTGANHLVAIDMNVSLNEKAKLRKWIEARSGRPIPDGTDYDISRELGQPCLLNVVEKNGYPRVEGVGGVPKGTTVAKATRTPFAWTLEDYAKSGDKIDLPDWIPWLFGRPIAEHIRECRELATDAPPPAPVASAPAASAGAAPPRPPARKPAPPAPAAPAASKFWLAKSDAADPILVTLDELKHVFSTESGIDWKSQCVCLDGSEQWLPLHDLIPASSTWVPF